MVWMEEMLEEPRFRRKYRESGIHWAKNFLRK
jgi:hypothetical protein